MESNAGRDFARQFEAAMGQIEQAITEAATEAEAALAERGLAIKQEEVQRTYSRPEAERAPKRTNAWRDGQEVQRSGQQLQILTTGEAAEYEARLEDLPTGADGVNRSNPAAVRTHERLEEEAEQLVTDHFGQALRDKLGR